MTATLQDIQHWLEQAKINKATHLIVAVDTYDHDNYPVYVTSDENVQDEMERITVQSMQSIDEVYNMSMSIEKQLKERRAYHC